MTIVKKEHVLLATANFFKLPAYVFSQTCNTWEQTDLLVACWTVRLTFCERLTISFETQNPEEQRNTITDFPGATLS